MDTYDFTIGYYSWKKKTSQLLHISLLSKR